MSDDVSKPRYRSRVPCDREYISALGQAAYSYSYLEWQAICVARKIEPAFITEDMYSLSNGKIARAIYDLVKSKKKVFGPELYVKLKTTVQEMWEAGELRNDMLHAYPYSAESGAQRLGRRINGNNVEWTFERFDAAIAFFEELSGRLNDLFYKDLADFDVLKLDSGSTLLALPKPDETA